MISRMLVIVCIVLFLPSLNAQKLSKEAKRQFTLNSYIDYLNYASEDLFGLNHDLQSVYQDVLNHYKGLIKLKTGGGSIQTLNLLWGTRGNNFLKNYYEQSVSDYDTWHNITVRIFDSISISFNTFLQIEEQQIVYPQLQKLHATYLNIYKYYDEISHHLNIRNSAYLKSSTATTNEFNKISICLDSVAMCFAQFKLYKEALEKSVASLQEKNIPEAWKRSGFYVIAKASTPLINAVNIFCNKIHSGDTAKLQQSIEVLTNLKIALQNTANPILDTMFTFNKRAGNDPRFRFDEYMSVVNRLISLGKQLQTGKDFSYTQYGKNNIIGFYNKEVIWPAFQFERAFNDFIDLANGKKRLDEALCCYSDHPRLDKTVIILPKISFIPVRFDTDNSLLKNIVPPDSSKVQKDSIAQLISTSAFSHLVLLLDVSSSMKAPQRLDVLKNALQFIITYLRTEDKISIVLFSGTARAVIENVSGMEKQKLAQTIDQLKSDGRTNADAGIITAYEMAKKYFIPNGNNRIIVGTDGDFSLANQSKDLVKEFADKGIVLSCLLLGNDAHSSIISFLEQISEKGNGHFYKVDANNAKEILLKEITAIKLNL